MKLLIAFAVFILAVNGLSLRQQWKNFKTKYGNQYKTVVEEKARFGIFQNNLKTIAKHNDRFEQGLETYTMGVNQFADMTPKEFSDMLKLQIQHKPVLNATLHKFPEIMDVPDSIDWRDKGAVLDVKDQGKCASSWAFSAIGALEGQNAILNNKKIPLSAQQLVDCTARYGNGDCSGGGEMTLAFKYSAVHGLEAESTYPYTGIDQSCNAYARRVILKSDGFNLVDHTETDLKNAVGTVGPVTVGIYADPIQLYSSGIFSSTDCTKKILANYGALVVGYGQEDGKDFWIIKNSWGTSWGESGYLRLERNTKQCGIATHISYPTLK